MKNKSKKIIKIIPLILLIIALISILSYALLTIDFEGTKISGLKKPEVSLSLEENKNIELTLDEMTNDEGIFQPNYVEFTVSSTGKYNGNIPVYIYLKEIERAPDDIYEHLKIELVKIENGVGRSIINSTKIINLAEIKEDSTNYLMLLDQTNFDFTDTQKKTYSINYKLRLWLTFLSNEGFSSKTESDGSVTGETKDQNYVFRIKVMTKRLKQGEQITEDYPATEQLAATTSQRYIGHNPDNYVSFNDELWRIIGTFDVDDGTGKLEKRIKIIRNKSIGYMAWDSNNIGDWTKSSLMTLLNSGDYWNRTGNYASTGLTEEAKNQIADAKWYLGIVNKDWAYTIYYKYERGTEVYGSRPTSWTGKVGLMYPSDYAYATSGSSKKSRESCLKNDMDYIYSDVCSSNNWLYYNNEGKWTITPEMRGQYANRVFYVLNGYADNSTNANDNSNVIPTVYLKPDIQIAGGTGTESDPFILSKK